jgi:hypothetical protein
MVALAAVAVAAASLVVAAVTMASQGTRVSFEFTPSTVPRDRYEAGAIDVHLRTAVPPQTRASRIRFDFDDHFRFAPGGFPVCDREDISNGQVDMATAMARCGSAKVGSGTAQAAGANATFSTCVLIFNGPRSEDGVRTVLLHVRVQFPPQVADCSDPASNHGGNFTLLVVGFLGHSKLPGYRRELRFNRLNRVEPVPLTDLELTFQRDDYVSARCSVEDLFRGWQVRTKVGYVEPRRVEVVNSTQQCFPLGGDRADAHQAGLRE